MRRNADEGVSGEDREDKVRGQRYAGYTHRKRKRSAWSGWWFIRGQNKMCSLGLGLSNARHVLIMVTREIKGEKPEKKQ